MAQEILLLNKVKANLIPANTKFSGNAQFKQHAIHLATNEWLVVNTDTKGQGGFGSVSQAKIKVVLNKDKVTLYPVTIIVKKQKIETQTQAKGKTNDVRATQIAAIKKEAVNQLKHRVNVQGFFVDGDYAYIMMDDCGPSLDKILPNCNYDFDKRLAIACGIVNEMLILHQTDTIHRDLKPANICVNHRSEVRFIDFGLAESNDVIHKDNTSGTPLYMAPDPKFSFKSDIYSLSAILAELFECPGLFYNKCRAGSSYCYYTDYDFRNLFKGLKLPPDIDKQLIDDFKKLFELMGAQNPSQRPDLTVISKFLLSIQIRRNYTKELNKELPEIKRIDNLLSKTETNLFAFLKREFTSFKNNFTNPKSHYDESSYIARTNRRTSEYDDPYSLAEFDKIKETVRELEKQIPELKKSEAKFQGTNSTGIEDFFKIVNSPQSVIEIAEAIKALGLRKTEDNLANWYSRSSFFGAGRHENIETFYKKCADLDLTNFRKDFSALTQWLSRSKLKDFVHEKTSCCMPSA